MAAVPVSITFCFDTDLLKNKYRFRCQKARLEKKQMLYYTYTLCYIKK